MRAYILLNTTPGGGHRVVDALNALRDERLAILHADIVLGPYDVVLECESANLDALGEALERVVQTIPGVVRTTTCLSVRFA